MRKSALLCVYAIHTIIILLCGCTYVLPDVKAYYDSLTAERRTANEITVFRLMNKDGTLFSDCTVDAQTHVIHTSVAGSLSFSSLAAVFELTGGTVRVNGVPQVSGVTLNDFTQPVQYEVTAYDGSVRSYTAVIGILYSLTFYTNGGTWQPGYSPSAHYENLQDVRLPEAEHLFKSGYSFSGWYEDSAFYGRPVTGWPAGSRSKGVTLYAKWDENQCSITVTTPDYSDRNLNLSHTITGNTVTFTAEAGYDDYRWYVDGAPLTGTSENTCLLDVSGYKAGKYDLMLIVLQGADMYSATCQFAVQR